MQNILSFYPANPNQKISIFVAGYFTKHPIKKTSLKQLGEVLDFMRLLQVDQYYCSHSWIYQSAYRRISTFLAKEKLCVPRFDVNRLIKRFKIKIFKYK